MPGSVVRDIARESGREVAGQEVLQNRGQLRDHSLGRELGKRGYLDDVTGHDQPDDLRRYEGCS